MPTGVEFFSTLLLNGGERERLLLPTDLSTVGIGSAMSVIIV